MQICVFAYPCLSVLAHEQRRGVEIHCRYVCSLLLVLWIWAMSKGEDWTKFGRTFGPILSFVVSDLTDGTAGWSYIIHLDALCGLWRSFGVSRCGFQSSTLTSTPNPQHVYKHSDQQLQQMTTVAITPTITTTTKAMIKF